MEAVNALVHMGVRINRVRNEVDYLIFAGANKIAT